MTAGRSTTGEMTELLEKLSITDKNQFKWSGDGAELKSFIKNLLIIDWENKDENVLARFKCMPLSLTITLCKSNKSSEKKTVLFQGKDVEKIKQLISSHRDKEAHHHYLGCCPIYENEYKHIIRRVDEKPILGYPYQFCAAFFHTHKRGVGDEVKKHQCLDESRCIISKRALDEGFKVQPKTVVAIVKFENNEGVKYEAKYTNCVSAQKHAEDFFKDDVEKGELKNKIDENPKGTITMYLTLPPCNKSVSIKGTKGTPADKSCCDTLKNMYNKTLKDKIELRIKVTHPYRLSTSEAKGDDETLRKRAMKGIENLMDADIRFSAMNKEDWDYLSSMTMEPRDELGIMKPRVELDQEIERIVEHIRTKTKRKTSTKKGN